MVVNQDRNFLVSSPDSFSLSPNATETTETLGVPGKRLLDNFLKSWNSLCVYKWIDATVHGQQKDSEIINNSSLKINLKFIKLDMYDDL